MPLIDSLRLLRFLYRVPEERHAANLRRLRAMLAFDGESVHHVFLHAFLCFPDAQYVLSLFSTGVQCFTKIFSVVV
ncbi:MAG: hypothetical protein AUI01_08810 [Ktedonobacter sp. 13_2_20CM_2_56_8]|nr:MAG: hypothetical protein AUI01_08810 [Ktedonobacter sp. 13_2_20CM_2_56_8]